MQRIVRRVRRHTVYPPGDIWPPCGWGGGQDQTLALEELHGEARVGVCLRAGGPNEAEGVVEREGKAPHEVCHNEGGGARGAARAVHKGPPAAAEGGVGLLDEVEDVVEKGGDVLPRLVAKPQRLVVEFTYKPLPAGESGAVEYVGDAVAAQQVAISRGGVASQIDVVGDAG